MQYLHEVPAIRTDLQYLLDNDRVFKKLDITPEDLLWGYSGPGFHSLVSIVIGQQLSTAAARTVNEKFAAAVKKVEPKRILKLTNEELRAPGLSQQKANYIRGLCEAIVAGDFDPHALETLSDEDVYTAITALKGFGTWSAEMYLMFSLARPDIWAPKDLGIQGGMQLYLKLPERPDADRVMKEGKRFAPRRTAASLLLWYIKGQDNLKKKEAKVKK